MTTAEIINSIILAATAVFIFLTVKSPIKAVEVGRKLNDEQEIDKRKKDLFLKLFAYRGIPLHSSFIEALNQVEIVFHDESKVLQAWYNLYDALQIGDEKETIHHLEKWEELRVVLLDAMARSLNYTSLQQLRIQKPYYPRGLWDFQMKDRELKDYGLEFLKNGNAVWKILIDQSNAQQEAVEKKEV